MAGRIEYVNVSGLRVDGRRRNEVRRLRCELSLVASADGSALVEQGNTKVLALVHGPKDGNAAARRSGGGPSPATTSSSAAAAAAAASGGEHEPAALLVDFAVAPFAQSDRKKRRAGDRRLLEAAETISRVFSSVVDTAAYPRSAIEISLQVLAADGGVLAAAINATTLALIDAGIAMSDFVVGIGVAYINRTPLLDPAGQEATSGAPELTLAVLPKTGDVSLASLDAKLPLEAFETLLAAGATGGRAVFELLRGAVVEATADALEARAALGGGVTG